MNNKYILSLLMILTAVSVSVAKAADDARRWPEFAHKTFRFQDAAGIGLEKLCYEIDVQVPSEPQ